MQKNKLWVVFIIFIINSCGIKPSSETDIAPVTATIKPISTLTSETINATEAIKTDAEFNLSTMNETPPDDILNEISYYVGGGGGVCLPAYEKPLTFDFNLDIEQLHLEQLNICGWVENETIKVTILNPDGKISTQTISATGKDFDIYYATVGLKFRIDEPTGTYKFTFEGDSGTGTVNVNVHKPNGTRLLRMDDTHLLFYGFKPLESVNLYYYFNEKFTGWQNYKVDEQGQLAIEIPAYRGYRHPCMGLVDDFFVAIGEKSGEVRLLQDTCAGSFDTVMENSIIWSCGNLKTRLSISSSKEKRVAYTDGTDMRIRKNPGFNEEIIDSVPEGTKIIITEGPKCVDNVTWWKISGGPKTNEAGWMAEHNNEIYWLEPMP